MCSLPGVSIAIMYDEILLLFEHVCLKLIDWSFNPYLSSDQIETDGNFHRNECFINNSCMFETLSQGARLSTVC